jgi:hypothetical protein
MTLLPDLERSFLEAAERHERSAQREDDARTSAPSGRPARTRRLGWRRPLVGGGALALASAAVVVALVGLPGGRERLSVVAEASAALAPKDGILYLSLLSHSRATMGGKPIRSSGQAALVIHSEEWSTQDPRRYRVVVHQSKETSRWNPDAHLQPHTETSWANGAQTSYNRDHARMRTISGFSPNSSASRSLALWGGTSLSLDDVRAMLRRGALVRRGDVQLRGQLVARLVGSIPRMRGTRVEYLVDLQTFQPRRVIVRANPFGLNSRESRMLNTSVTDVLAYKLLPLTPQNERLLTIHPPAGTRIQVQTLEEARAAGRRELRRMNAEGRRNLRRMQRQRARATPTP